MGSICVTIVQSYGDCGGSYPLLCSGKEEVLPIYLLSGVYSISVETLEPGCWRVFNLQILAYTQSALSSKIPCALNSVMLSSNAKLISKQSGKYYTFVGNLLED